MRFFLLFFFYVLFLNAGEPISATNTTLVLENKHNHASIDNNDTKNANEVFVVEDTSGLTNEQIRKQAKENDDKVKEKEKLDDDIDALLDGTFDEQVTKEKTWEDLSPTPVNYDWIQTKSGEWFKGYIKAMFDKTLEFDSDEINIHTFKFKNVVQIKSYQVIGVNIDHVAIFEGIIRLKNDKITIIQGNNKFEFPKDDVISFAYGGNGEKDKWYAKLSISVDWRSGNTNQLDYSAQAVLKRRTAKTKLVFDYLGKYTAISDVETVSNQRINEKFDIYLTKILYITPLFSEIYSDNFKNINIQLTGGIGIGYLLVNTYETELDFTIGPAMLYTEYVSVSVNEDKKISSYSAEFAVRYKTEVTKEIDFTFNYKFSLTDNATGLYKHHMLFKFENELTDWLDLDFTYVWDYIDKPTQNAKGIIPEKDDYQFLLGLGIEF